MPRKATHKTNRQQVKNLTDIVNIGPAIAADFELLGISTPQKLIGKNPLTLYKNLIEKTAKFHDPCVLDVFIAAVDFMNGNPPVVWWKYTDQRKKLHSKSVDRLRNQYRST